MNPLWMGSLLLRALISLTKQSRSEGHSQFMRKEIAVREQTCLLYLRTALVELCKWEALTDLAIYCVSLGWGRGAVAKLGYLGTRRPFFSSMPCKHLGFAVR